MLIIHQRKSAGTSLLYTLSSLLEVEIDPGPDYDTYKNKQKRFSYFESLVDAKTPIVAFHLHPTKDNYNWVVNNRIKCLILLRNPENSYEAMFRHASLDGKILGTNSNNSKAALYEFYNNWLSLKDLDHVCMVFFEKLVQNNQLVVNEIIEFYDLDLKGKSVSLQKKRFTGVGLTENLALNHTHKAIGPLTFKYNPHKRTFVDSVLDLYLIKCFSSLLKKSTRFKRLHKKIKLFYVKNYLNKLGRGH